MAMKTTTTATRFSAAGLLALGLAGCSMSGAVYQPSDETAARALGGGGRDRGAPGLAAPTVAVRMPVLTESAVRFERLPEGTDPTTLPGFGRPEPVSVFTATNRGVGECAVDVPPAPPLPLRNRLGGGCDS